MNFIVKGIEIFLGKLNKIEEIFISIVLLSATILLFINVITRYCFGFSFKWAEEITRYMIIWVTFIGSSVCVRKQKHVGIDALLMKCPMNISWILKLIILVIGILFSCVLTIYGWKLTGSVVASGQLSPAMMLPMYLVYIAIPVGGGLMIIRYFQVAFDVLNKRSL